jgi:hypothetical protein
MPVAFFSDLAYRISYVIEMQINFGVIHWHEMIITASKMDDHGNVMMMFVFNNN